MVSGVSPETNVAAMKRLVARAAGAGGGLKAAARILGADRRKRYRQTRACLEPWRDQDTCRSPKSETAKECGLVQLARTELPTKAPEASQPHEYSIRLRTQRANGRGGNTKSTAVGFSLVWAESYAEADTINAGSGHRATHPGRMRHIGQLESEQGREVLYRASSIALRMTQTPAAV